MYRAITFYEDDTRDPAVPTRGGIYWSCVQFGYDSSMVERVHRDERPWQQLDVTAFDPDSEEPSTVDRTESSEFLGVQKFKTRPVVVLSQLSSELTARMQARWRGGNHVIVAPVYSLWDRSVGQYNCDAEFLVNAIKYSYPSTFFLPGHHKRGILAGVVRLEYSQAVNKAWLRQGGRGTKLTQDAMKCLDEWFQYYLRGRLHKGFTLELLEYRKLLEGDGVVEITSTHMPSGLYED